MKRISLAVLVAFGLSLGTSVSAESSFSTHFKNQKAVKAERLKLAQTAVFNADLAISQKDYSTALENVLSGMRIQPKHALLQKRLKKVSFLLGVDDINKNVLYAELIKASALRRSGNLDGAQKALSTLRKKLDSKKIFHHALENLAKKELMSVLLEKMAIANASADHPEKMATDVRAFVPNALLKISINALKENNGLRAKISSELVLEKDASNLTAMKVLNSLISAKLASADPKTATPAAPVNPAAPYPYPYIDKNGIYGPQASYSYGYPGYGYGGGVYGYGGGYGYGGNWSVVNSAGYYYGPHQAYRNPGQNRKELEAALDKIAGKDGWYIVGGMLTVLGKDSNDTIHAKQYDVTDLIADDIMYYRPEAYFYPRTAYPGGNLGY